MGTEILETTKEKLVTRLNEFFWKVDYVELAYLFGSHSKEKAGPLSDIDIGVYLSRSLNKKEAGQNTGKNPVPIKKEK